MVKCDCGHEFEPVIEYQHRLLIGDCTVRENVERLMGGERAVMMFTDPPYNFQTEGGGALHEQYAKTAERIADIVDFDPSLFLEILPAYFTERICAYVFCSPNYGGVILERFYTATGITPELVE